MGVYVINRLLYGGDFFRLFVGDFALKFFFKRRSTTIFLTRSSILLIVG